MGGRGARNRGQSQNGIPLEALENGMEDDLEEEANEIEEGQFDDYEDGMDEEFYENEAGEDEEYGDEE